MKKLGIAICVLVIGFFGVYAASGANFLNDPQKSATQQETSAQTEQAQQEESSSQPEQSSSSAKEISAEEAQNIALKDAKREANAVQNLRSKLKEHKGIGFYEVEFSADNKKYGYAVASDSGEIMGRRFELDESQYGKLKGSRLSEQGLKDMLQKRMEADAFNNLKFKQENDDGLNLYEGSAASNTMKYEFKIDSATGTTVEWQEEKVIK